jgi:two-component system chemotaxis sensor kinase CheA
VGTDRTTAQPELPARPSTAAPEHAADADAIQVMRSVAQTVRVDIRKLDGLMNVVGELAIVKGTLSRVAERLRAEGNRQVGLELHRIHRNFDRRLQELQSGILEVRMVPLGQVFDRLARVVRQISREMNKDIRLVITGAETEIDKLIVEELSDPLMHIVRNAIDHGIESAVERERVGKPVAGTIALNAFQKGNHVVIEVEDDGRGIDEDALIERAVALGKVERSEVNELARSEVLGLIFLPGVTTREEAGDYSGRGVGMDVVKTNISKLGGVIDVHSEHDIGTKLTITLPVTLAIVSALLVRVLGRTFAMPLTSVAEAIVFDESQIRVVDGREVMTLRGATLPICRLSTLFRLSPVEGPSAKRRFVVVAALGSRRLGFAVDDLLGQQDIVIKSLGPSLSRVRGFAGATELGDQRVALVLDAAGLIEEMLSATDNRREERRFYG